MENRIDELHDDILVRILSLLTLKEAGQTSILSKRWRDLWAYVPNLHFDTDHLLREDVVKAELEMEEEEPMYVRWVEQVMSSHKALTIDEFRVQYNLLSNRKDTVDNWVKSASEKRVKKFQLSLSPWHFDSERYSLPSLSLFTSLTSLELAKVDVSDKVLEKILHDCPLEHLLLFKSLLPEYLKVVGPHLKLKSLRIYRCQPSYDLEISAPNLTSFSYTGTVQDTFLLESLPKLTEIYFGGFYAVHVMDDHLSSLSRYSSQIEVLTMEIHYYNLQVEHVPTAREFPAWTKLKKLDIYISPIYDDQLFDLLPLIKACPSLHKFVLQLEMGSEVKRTAVTRNVESCPHHSLKILEIVRFIGWELDVGFVECLIENAVSLEKIIFELVDYDIDDEPCVEERTTRARHQAEKMRAKLNPGTELEIRNECRMIPHSIYPF